MDQNAWGVGYLSFLFFFSKKRASNEWSAALILMGSDAHQGPVAAKGASITLPVRLTEWAARFALARLGLEGPAARKARPWPGSC